jgi:hypothetical protein
MHSKGFVIFAQENSKVDYLRQAYALALSIKNHMLGSKTCLITNINVPEHMSHVFDYILDIPGEDLAKDTDWKIHNRCKIYDATPFDQSIILDADMLICSDISHWWNFLTNFNLFFTNHVMTYRNELINDLYYRKTFIKNQLPNLYCGMHYYQKCKANKPFVDLLKQIIENYEKTYDKILTFDSQAWCSMDVCVSLAAKMLNITDKITSRVPYITFTHMKPHIQNWQHPTDHWMKKVNVYFDTQCSIKIDNFMQQGILHYVEPEFLSQGLLENLERIYHEHY